MQQRVALVTGSTQGIGLAIARRIAADGVALVVNGLVSEAEGAEVVERLTGEYGIEAIFHNANMGDPEQIDALMDVALERFGRIDILVNNAGTQFTAPIEAMPVEQWHRIIAINLSASFFTMRRAVPGMQERGWGRIINIASVHGLVASVQKAPYVASKHGLVGLTRVVALENAARGITANCICPGWVETPLIEPQIQSRAAQKGVSRDDAVRDLLAEKQPSLQTSSPDQIAALAGFLCSDAAANITGAAIPVDGGWTAQ